MNLNFYINSIYRATEGEGLFIGTPQVFVRFQGCNVGCLNCDSKDTWDFDKMPAQSLDQVLTLISTELGQGIVPLKRVSITGGDPLHPIHEKPLLALCQELKKRDIYISLEASGTRIVSSIFDLVDFINFDFKTPSTGVSTKKQIICTLIEQFSSKFQIKSVIQDQVDFDYTYQACKQLMSKYPQQKIPWVLTPVYNVKEEFPQKRFEEVLRLNELYGAYFRVIGQQHKWIFGPDKKQV